MNLPPYRRIPSLLPTAAFAGLWILMAVFYFSIAVHATTPLLDGDDAVYALMTDYFSPFSGRSSAIVELVMRHSIFPPFYPFVLGIVGADSSHLGAMHAVTVGFFLVALAMLFWWGRAELGSATLAGLAAAVFALLPVTIAQSFRILSENLYLLLSLAALCCMTRQDDRRWFGAAMVCVALACLTRTVGVALLFACLLCLRQASFVYRARLALIVALPALAWALWKALHGYHGGYDDALADGLRGGQWLDLIERQLRAPWRELWGGWTAGFDDHPTMTTLVVGSAVGTLGLAGALQRASQRKIDGIYVLLYLLIVLVWPYSYEARRFLFPIFPILLIQGLLFAGTLVRWRPHRLAVAYPYVYLAMIALIVFPAMAMTVDRYLAAQLPENRALAVLPSWYAYENLTEAKARAAEQLAFVAAWERIKDKIEDNQCAYHIKPVAFMLYADRLGYVPPWVPPDRAREFPNLAMQCRYFYVGAYVYYPYRDAFYPQKYLQDVGRVLDAQYVEVNGARRLIGLLLDAKRS
jgi:4-amino-4-deoxy-L-arabinose transferase-like glycosyltransferase